MILQIEGLFAGYGSAVVLRGIDLAVAPGEMVALVGANGAGKTTLLKAISGLIPLRRGTIALNGAQVGRLPAAARVRRGISHVPEGRQIFSELSVDENLQLGAFAQRRALDATEFERRRAGVFALFPPLRERRSAPAGTLSGGQQQMLAIGRGLMAKPALLLLDEPSLGLSPVLVAEIFRTLASLRATGVSVLLAEQNARLSLAIADRGYVLENGTIAVTGSGRELLHSAAVTARYLGVAGGTTGIAERAATRALATRLADALRPA